MQRKTTAIKATASPRLSPRTHLDDCVPIGSNFCTMKHCYTVHYLIFTMRRKIMHTCLPWSIADVIELWLHPIEMVRHVRMFMQMSCHRVTSNTFMPPIHVTPMDLKSEFPLYLLPKYCTIKSPRGWREEGSKWGKSGPLFLIISSIGSAHRICLPICPLSNWANCFTTVIYNY